MFGIGTTELVIIVIFGFLLFGPDKMPQMGRTIGRALRQFRETQEKLTAVVQTEVVDPMNEIVSEPVKPKKKADGTPEADPDSDDDADADAAAQAPRKTETFAERRARLAAEREQKAAEAAAATGEDAVDGAEPAAMTAAAAAADADEAQELQEEPAEVAAPEVSEEPAVRTTRDLYARRPRKKAEVPAAEPQPTAEPAPVEPAAEPEPVVPTEPAEGGDE